MKNLEKLDISVLNSYPTPDESAVDQLLSEEFRDFNKKVVVLDDDPTGTQTVHDVPVFTDWTQATFENGLKDEHSMFFILTNSRSFSKDETIAVHTDIAKNLAAAGRACAQDFLLISRGDSTLRGHFPLETEVLKNTLEHEGDIRYDGEIICPFFMEGGRFTLNNIHYVKEGNDLIPAGMTEFAKDKSFGYNASHLGEYVEEKSLGTYKAADCTYISLKQLRGCDYDDITAQLMAASDYSKIIVNAIDYIDIKVFMICWLRAMKAGKNYIVRSAAPLTRVAGNISPAPLLTKIDLIEDGTKEGGLVIIGSHVKKTSDQLDALMASDKNFTFLEFFVERYFTDGSLDREVERVLTIAQSYIQLGKTVVIYTSRQLLVPDTADKDQILKLSVNISDALTSIVRLLSLKPKFIIAKGGITSSDVATKGLGIKKARVMGQIKKGIPVWLSGPESKFPGTPYIIFPGNVGDVTTLREIVEELD